MIAKFHTSLKRENSFNANMVARVLRTRQRLILDDLIHLWGLQELHDLKLLFVE